MSKCENISLIISSICKEQGIDYCSTNPHLITLMEDAQKINKIYIQLKNIIEILIEIEDRHNITGLKELIEQDLLQLDKIDHHLLQIAKKMRESDEE